MGKLASIWEEIGGNKQIIQKTERALSFLFKNTGVLSEETAKCLLLIPEVGYMICALFSLNPHKYAITGYHYLHFIDDETGGQRGYRICPRSPARKWWE